MQKWEYTRKLVDIERLTMAGSDDPFDYILDVVGDQGWELIVATPTKEPRVWSFFFKRPRD